MAASDPTVDPEDVARLIQEILSELGHAADSKAVAARVRALDRGLPAEDEFSVICSWLGQTRLIHKLDQLQAPAASRGAFQVPDLLAAFHAGGPVVIEVKVSKQQTLSFKPDYLGKLQAYADLLGHPLLIAWKFHSIWTLFEARHLTLARTNFNITHSEAMRQNLLGVVVGDIAFVLGPRSGLHFNAAKEALIETSRNDPGDPEGFTETWQARWTDIFFTDRNGARRDDLHPETKQIFAAWDLQQREEHFPDRFVAHFEPGENQVQFAHVALVYLLGWERKTGEPVSWRHLLRAPSVVRSIANFGAALERALDEKVVHCILRQRPNSWPAFLPPQR